MVELEGKYQHVRSEKFDEFLKAMGVPMVPRMMVLSSNPVVEVSRVGDTWTISNSMLFKTVTYTFTPGEVVYSESVSGQAENVFEVEEDCIRQTQRVNNVTIEILRTFTESGLLMTMTHQGAGVTCRRYFKRME